MNNVSKSLKFVPKLWPTIIYFLLIFVLMYLFMGRSYESVRVEALLKRWPDFYSHVSNFTISFIIVLVSGYIGLLRDGALTYGLVIVCLVILANIIYEGFIPILNTPDWVDAIYGVIGSVLPVIYFIIFKYFGLRVNPDYQP